MASPIEAKHLSDLAASLYPLLPASGAKFTFGTAAELAGVAAHWGGVIGRSKGPAILEMLTSVWDRDRPRFSVLLEEIVKGAIDYRRRKDDPLRRPEVERVNAVLLKLHVKTPSLWDPTFLNALSTDDATTPTPKHEIPATPATIARVKFDLLHQRFGRAIADSDRQRAGFELEKILHELFAMASLQPDGPFRISGEQIDGAFKLNGNNYILESRWRIAPSNAADLYAFLGKVAGKSAYTRGLFLSINGFSDEALDALGQGKENRIVLMDGAHLDRVMRLEFSLDGLLRRLVDELERRGRPYTPISEL